VLAVTVQILSIDVHPGMASSLFGKRPWVKFCAFAPTCAEMNLGLPKMVLHMFSAQASPISPQGDRRRDAKVFLRYLLNLLLGQCGEIRRLSGDNSLKRIRMMGLQILTEETDRAALARCVPDEDDRFGMDNIRGYLLVVGFLLGDMITLVMRFLAVD